MTHESERQPGIKPTLEKQTGQGTPPVLLQTLDRALDPFSAQTLDLALDPSLDLVGTAPVAVSPPELLAAEAT